MLLFDGFDELVTRLTYDRAADHLETLLAAAEDKAKIVVASRTQHFKSGTQVLTSLGEKVGCCRSGGCSASRTSPATRSAPTWSTASAATRSRAAGSR